MYSQSFTNSENVIVNYQGNENRAIRTIKQLFMDKDLHISFTYNAREVFGHYLVIYDDGPDWEFVRQHIKDFRTYNEAEAFFISIVESMTGQKFESIPQTTRTM